MLPRILHRVVLPLSLLSACGGGSDGPRTAILITIDTTRPGALDCYGEDRGITPHLSAFAREAVVFDEARAVTPVTLPSHTSLMTGLYPPRHGVRDNGLIPLPASAETLAEAAKSAGMATAAFTAAAILAPTYGLDQGFDVYDAPDPSTDQAAARIVQRDADEVVRRTVTWLEAQDLERPFFLWVHFYDPHFPYRPPQRFLDQAGGDAYLGEVAWVDDAIGRIFDALRRRGSYDASTIAVVADHGESLGEHGEKTHGLFAYDSTLRIPLLLRLSGGERGGTRRSEPVTQVDVYSTLLEAMGFEPPRTTDGVSLLGEDLPGDRGVYFEAYMPYFSYRWSHQAGWVEGGRKFIHSSSPELYDLRSDPGEERNLVAGGDAREALAAITDLGSRPVLEVAEFEGLTDEEREAVQALGYAGVSDVDTPIPAPLEPTDLPHPRDRLGEYDAVDLTFVLAGEGRKAEAIEILQGVVSREPQNVQALNFLGRYLAEEGRHDEAAAALERLVRLEPLLHRKNEAWVRQYLGFSHQRKGEWKEAAGYYERALELAPTEVRLLMDAARVFERLGRGAEARALVERARELGAG